MLAGILAAAIALCLLGVVPTMAWRGHEFRQQVFWVGAAVGLAAALPDRWLALTLAVIGLSCLCKPPVGLTMLSLPPVVSWFGLYLLLSTEVALSGWRIILSSAVAVVASGGAYSVLMRWCRAPEDGATLRRAWRIPFTRIRIGFWNAVPMECGWFGNPSMGAVGMAAMLPAAVGLAATGSPAWHAATALILLGIVLTRSRGGWLATACGAAVYLWFRWPMLGFVATVSLVPSAALIGEITLRQSNGLQRLEALRQTWSVWRKFSWPLRLTGAGLWGWWCWLGDGRERLGFLPTKEAHELRKAAAPDPVLMHLHNEWAQAAFEHGPLIVVGALGFLASTGWRLWHSPDPWAAPVAAGLSVYAVASLWQFPLRLADMAAILLLWLVGAAQVR